MRTPVALFLLALVIRLVLVAGFADPAYPDAFYYVDVARRLAAGEGLTIDVVWVFAEVGGGIPADPVLPIPSNAHWMPLASFVQVPFILVLGPTAVASALPFALAGAVTAPLTWLIARDAGLVAWGSLAAGLLAAAPAMTLPFMVQPDNFALYQPLVAGALLLAARGLRGDARAFAAAGALAGLATLSRNDGVLVLAVLALLVVGDRLRARRGGARPRIPIGAAAGAVAGFAVTAGPWYLRQLAVFGQLSPSAASGKVLYIREIAEWNSITTPATLEHLLGMGLGPLLATRVAGLVAALVIFTVLVGAIALVPPLVAGAWSRRHDPAITPFLAYAVLLLAFSTIVSAVHVPGGTFIHSAVALVPHSYLLVVAGIIAASGAAARRRASWRADDAARVFAAGAVAFAAVTGAAGAASVHGSWAEKRDRLVAVDRALDAAGATGDDRVISIDAAGTRYWTGRPGVVLVNDPVPAIETVARAYGIRWLVLERADTVPAMAPVLLEGRRPAWLGPGIPVAGDALVLPVCLEPADPRCTAADADPARDPGPGVRG